MNTFVFFGHEGIKIGRDNAHRADVSQPFDFAIKTLGYGANGYECARLDHLCRNVKRYLGIILQKNIGADRD